MGCGTSSQAKGAKDPARMSQQYADMYKQAFGKTSTASTHDIDFFMPDTGPLSNSSYRKRLATSGGTQMVKLPKAGVEIKYAFVTQRGYYPDAMEKANQDALSIRTQVGSDPDTAFFAVFDGHGTSGTECANFARDKVYTNMLGDVNFYDDPASALANAVVKTNDQLHRSTTEDSLSGTTAVSVLIRGRDLTVANVGDSRCVAAEMRGADLIAVDLTLDQTPYRKDELERVKAAGARVLTLEQLDGLRDPSIQDWGCEQEDDGDPPRLWSPTGNYPGTAFTRSIGDSVAEEIGVIGTAEMASYQLKDSTAFVVIATDGVWEFLTSQAVVDMVNQHEDAHNAAMAVCLEAYQQWLSTEARTDDITVIVLEFQLTRGLTLNGSIPRSASRGSNLGSAGNSMHGLGRSLTKSKSIRKGLARGSIALLGTEEAEATEDSQVFLKPAPKTAEEEQYLRRVLDDHPQFRLAEPKLQEALSYFRKREVAEGDILVEQGQTGKYFFVVQSGTYALKLPAKKEDSEGAEASAEQTVRRYAPGAGVDSTFGEIALVSGAKPYGGFIVARSAGYVWALDKRAYKAAVQGLAAPSRTLSDL